MTMIIFLILFLNLDDATEEEILPLIDKTVMFISKMEDLQTFKQGTVKSLVLSQIPKIRPYLPHNLDSHHYAIKTSANNQKNGPHGIQSTVANPQVDTNVTTWNMACLKAVPKSSTIPLYIIQTVDIAVIISTNQKNQRVSSSVNNFLGFPLKKK